MQEFLVLRYETTIDAPLQLVVDCIHKDEHITKWNSLVVENVYDNENEEVRLGSKYISRQKLSKNKIDEFQCEITEFEENRLVTVATTTKEGVSKTRYTFNEVEDGTELTVECYLQPSNWYHKMKTKLTKPLIKFVYIDQFEECEAYIYQQLEKHVA